MSVSLWSFKESSLFAVGVVLVGFALELFGGASGVAAPSWPLNGVVLALFFANIVLVAHLLRQNRFILWLGGIPLGLCLILSLALLSFIGGILLQEPGAGPLWAQKLRLNGVFSSWPFALTVFFFLVNLGLSLVWKSVPFKTSNLQFILFHAGFWIALACGLMGGADLKRVIIPLYEGQSTAQAYNTVTKTMVDLPFTLSLEDFEMQEYNPRLALYDPDSDRFVPEASGNAGEIAEGMTLAWDGLEVRVEKFLPSAVTDDRGRTVPADAGEGMPYAFLAVNDAGKPFSGWVSTGSPFEKPAFLEAGGRLLVLVPGSPKKFRSAVTVTNGGVKNGLSTVLEVNKPVSVQGWKLYQMGYDEKSGRWSELSIVEGVRDPWLPAVYLGFFMIMAGNTLFFWKGIRKSR